MLRPPLGNRPASIALVLMICMLLTWSCKQQDAVELEAEASPTRPRGIVLITIDTLRADRLGAYGYSRGTSPSMDRLAAQGVRFSNVYAQRGQTWPSLTSILTSRYPGSHGVRVNPGWLSERIPTLPEILKANGYSTAAFLTNMINGPNRGFDLVEGFPGDLPGLTTERTVDLLATERALQWLQPDRVAGSFYLWLHILAPHAPYTPPSPFGSMFGSPLADPAAGDLPHLGALSAHPHEIEAGHLEEIFALYDGEVRWADSLVGLVLERLKELAVEDQTLVVLTADHGEELFDRGNYFYHSCSISEGVLRIPLIMSLPGAIPVGHTVPEVIESIDIAPTILELAGLTIPESFQGKSLAGLIRAQGDAWEEVAFSELEEAIGSVRTKQWRYVANPLQASITIAGRGCYSIEREALYDLAADPLGLINVLDENRRVAFELRSKLREWRAATETETSLTRELDEETRSQLHALGYL